MFFVLRDDESLSERLRGGGRFLWIFIFFLIFFLKVLTTTKRTRDVIEKIYRGPRKFRQNDTQIYGIDRGILRDFTGFPIFQGVRFTEGGK